MASAPAAIVDTKLDEANVHALSERMRGRPLRPGDDEYEGARTVWNAIIDRRPALIARCAGAADVLAAVEFAREHDLLISVRGGGHNVAGNAVCEGGLMIDLSPMKGIRVDPRTRTARVEPGVLWGELDRETHAFGLATPGGVVSTTGIAGLTLGGGQSWLTGKHGFTIDNLLSVDIVTADGELRHASSSEIVDLFWAIRGAGHNFGVVTSFEYRLHPVKTVLGGMILHPFERAQDVLRFHQEFTASAPDELTVGAGIVTAPDGNQVAAFVACYSGPPDEGERVLAPLRGFGSPLADTIEPIPFPVMQSMLDGAFPHGRLNYWKSSLTKQVSDAAIEVIVEHAAQVPSAYTAILIGDFSGAGSRVGKQETAYYHRDLRYDFLIMSSWADPTASDRNIGWTREFFAAVEPHLSGGIYVNDLGDEGQERVRQAYGGNYERLVELKTRYDPTNVFRMNQNIRPAMS